MPLWLFLERKYGFLKKLRIFESLNRLFYCVLDKSKSSIDDCSFVSSVDATPSPWAITTTSSLRKHFQKH